MPKESRLDGLVALCHRRWSIPLLALLADGGGRRFVEFQQSLGIGRQALRDNLDRLIDLGLLRRNPGHGHPLRPEYLLNRRVGRLPRACADLQDFIARKGLNEPASLKWSLPVLAAIAQGAERYGEIRKRLKGISPRALAMALRELEDSGLLIRIVTDAHPPGVSYRLSSLGKNLSRRLGPLLASRLPAPLD